MTCVILQPSYIPWRGYFHQIFRSDVFVFYDDVQYDRHGWRNRNRIKTQGGLRWLTIPVRSAGENWKSAAIRDMKICSNRDWGSSHWETIRHSYRAAPFFARYASMLRGWYQTPGENLAAFTTRTTGELAAELGICGKTFLLSSQLGGSGGKTERLLQILKTLGARRYLSGPAARGYLNEQQLNDAGVEVEWMTYDYPPYPQLHPPYEDKVSALDLLLMKGPDAGRYIWT